MQHLPVVIGITGASGAPYALRLMRLLVEVDVPVHAAISPMGRRLLHDESGLRDISPASLVGASRASLVTLHGDRDLGASIASGSLLHRGMVIVPCSSNTLGAIAAGLTSTLVQRAAAVTLKEGRRLLVAHRESPLSRIDLANMDRLAGAGATIVPLSPGFYLQPRRPEDLVDFMAAKLADLLDVPHALDTRWESHVEEQAAR